MFCFLLANPWSDRAEIFSVDRAYQGDVFVKVSCQSAKRVRHRSVAKKAYVHHRDTVRPIQRSLSVVENRPCQKVKIES